MPLVNRIDPSWLKPGMTAPRTGIYRVYHYAHRAPHEVVITEGTELPTCRGCGEKVQYAPLIGGELIEFDADLAPPRRSSAVTQIR